MSVIGNDPKRLDGDIQAFSIACRTLNNEYVALKTGMDALQGMWEGEAHNALMTRFMSDYQSLGLIVDYMKAMEKSLIGACSSYEQCESRVRSAVSSLDF